MPDKSPLSIPPLAVPRQVLSRSARETRALAAALAGSLKPGAVLALHGDLGSGKTCFVQGLARELGVAQPIPSPTFTMVNEYRGRCRLVHMDLYRIQSEGELAGLDFDSYLESNGILVIEWAERAGGWLPADALHIRFEPGPRPGQRFITLSAGAPE